ncbi:MFS transporter [Candidatus Woesearchaeota archaeon]|nr:MFS transporter [Candidatus Woesearchaeota archaeon]
MHPLSFFKSKEWKLLWPFYTNAFILGLSTIMAAFEIIYFQELGITFSQIAKLLAIMPITIILTEIPTGAIADIYGRKISVITGFALLSIGYFTIPFLKTPASLTIVFVIFGLAGSFVSGAYYAWVVDFLKQNKQQKLTQNFMVKYASILSAGLILGPLIGSVLATFMPLKQLWLVNGAICLIAALVLAFFAAEKFEKQKIKLKSTAKEMIRTSKEAAIFVYKQKTLLLLTLASTFTILMKVGNLGWQPLLTQLAMPKNYLGYLYSAEAAVGVFAPFLANAASKRFIKKKNLFSSFTLATMVITLTLYFVKAPYFILASVISLTIITLKTVVNPIMGTFEQKFIPSKKRATIISTITMITALTAATALFISGKVMDFLGPKSTIILFAFFALPAIICYSLIKEN